MAAIHDLLKQIEDPRLRERLAREWDAATSQKKFGLVYEQHLPELLPLYNARPRKGDLVARRDGLLSETWRVRRVEGQSAHLIRPRPPSEREKGIESLTMPLTDLLVVRQFGEPIFPALTPMDAIQNGPNDAPWHTLIEADNYHALQLLDYLYAGKIDCIYIDPPYNSGARDWKYNNDYVDRADAWRHSKWLSMMQKRLQLARRLLNPVSGVLIVTIDENEVHHLGVMLEEIFPDYVRQTITIVINPKGTGKKNFARVEEYAMFCMPNAEGASEHVESIDEDEAAAADEDDPSDDDRSHLNPNFAHLWEKRHARRRGSESSYRHQRWNQFYPIFIDEVAGKVVRAGKSIPLDAKPDFSKTADGLTPIWPIDHDKNDRCWRFVTETMQSLIDQQRVVLGKFNKKKKTWTINIWEKKPESKKLKTVWWQVNHDAGTHGTTLLHTILNRRGAFAFPKSIYAVRDCLLPVVGKNKSAIVLDFFAGSGTTLSAVNLINSVDKGQRRCIMVTNNEVSSKDAEQLRREGASPGTREWEMRGICRSVTWPRCKFTMTGKRDDGSVLPSEYLTGRSVEVSVARNFRNLSFLTESDFIVPKNLDARTKARLDRALVKKQKALIALIPGLAQSLITEPARFVVSEDHAASILFDPSASGDWLLALEDQDHITDFFIVAESDAQFRTIKAQVDELLGPQVMQAEEKRPMAEGFSANLAYFKLDFLDKDQVEVGAAFRDIVPLLWLKAGASGPRPEVPPGQVPDWLAPETSNFAVLLTEERIQPLIAVLKGRRGLSHIFIVTDSEEAFRALSDEVRAALGASNPQLQLFQLYRDYLVNFMINARVDGDQRSAGGPA